jgi:hypothetical protein
MKVTSRRPLVFKCFPLYAEASRYNNNTIILFADLLLSLSAGIMEEALG